MPMPNMASITIQKTTLKELRTVQRLTNAAFDQRFSLSAVIDRALDNYKSTVLAQRITVSEGE